MKPIQWLFAVALALAPVTTARAGDTAELNVLGFSANGAVFAFEEFGVQVGSGFPFANRFYIDTATDSFVPGSPIRVRIDDETATLAQARAQAKSGGEAIIQDSELVANRGTLAGFNPITELSADPHRMAVNPRTVVPPVDEPVEFRIEEIYVAQPAQCEGLGEIKGYRLTRVGLAPGEAAIVLHEDSSVPSSRGCPLGYHLGAVQTFFPDGGQPVFAVLIAVRSFGFEGPDHRWIAVPGRL